MIVLDTNVVSELMRKAPEAKVVRFVAGCHPARLFTTSITQAEILFGLRILPSGRRRSELEAAAEAMFARVFTDRVLAFGSDAARSYADLARKRRAAGRPPSTMDTQIAAIAASSGATLATRNTRDFEGCGLELVDPWR